VINMAVGKDTHVSRNQPDPDSESAARRLADAFGPSAIDALLADAQVAGTPIDGVDGLLNQMTRAVLERALQTEMTHHLGYDRDDPAGAGTGNSRNGSSTKTVSTVNGPVTITVPRDRNGEFEPQIVPKRSRRVGQIDELVLSCYARGMSTRDIEAHLLEVYGVKASREMVSNITDVVTDEIEIWRNRPVDEVYPIVYIDGIRIKVRDKGAVTIKCAHLVIGVESINFQLRKITKTRGHFPSDEAAMKLLYLGLRNISSKRGGESGTGTHGWKTALNTLVVLFPGRLAI
jgi:transposase-like protein